MILLFIWMTGIAYDTFQKYVKSFVKTCKKSFVGKPGKKLGSAVPKLSQQKFLTPTIQPNPTQYHK